MRNLEMADYLVIAAYVLLCILTGLYFTRKANESTENYFLGGRSMPWWLLGTSMAATNFSTDTPLAVTKYIYQEGIAGVWFFWMGAIQVCLATFLFSQLWRRSEVMTDVEIVEKRYGGKQAAILRIFKGVYFGVIFNSIVMGWVYLGLIKIMTGVTNLDTTTVVVVFTLFVLVYTTASGFYGVVFTDFVQYIIAVVGCMVLAYYAVDAAGGMSNILTEIDRMYGKESGITNLYPSWPQAQQWMPLSVFFTYIFVQWWSHKFADGGGKHIQRMSSAKNERHAVFGTFFFSFMNYVVQVWPWILTALASLVIFGRDIKDPEMAYPMMMAKVLPSGFLGLLLVMAIAAFMSTISTHTNLGSSYLVNDIYRRFIKKDATDSHYLMVSKISTVIVLLMSIVVALNIKSIGGAWKLLAELASGAGVTWILRWFWWRVNAWSEMSAMLTSAVATIIIELMYPELLYSYKLWIIIGSSAVVWLSTTFLTEPVDEETLRKFVQKVGPSRFGWAHIYKKYNMTTTFQLRKVLVNLLAGLVFLFSLNFGVGNVLLLNGSTGWPQLGVATVTFVFLIFRILKQTENQSITGGDDTTLETGVSIGVSTEGTASSALS